LRCGAELCGGGHSPGGALPLQGLLFIFVKKNFEIQVFLNNNIFLLKKRSFSVKIFLILFR
jgi:hypothetical protein